jgi:hypothetical protein
MSGFSLENYTTVNERIIQFYDKYPQGIISTHQATIMALGESTFISVIAEVFPSPEALPLRAEAWEVFPGKTPYTRDSEMMNAATSAIGRALMQLGIGIEKAAASKEEVQARATPEAAGWKSKPQGMRDAIPASEKQISAVKKMMSAIPSELRQRTLWHLVGVDKFEDLKNGHIQTIFDGGKEAIGQAEDRAAQEALSGGIGAKPVEDDPWAVEKW